VIEVLQRLGHSARRDDAAVRHVFWDPFD